MEPLHEASDASSPNDASSFTPFVQESAHLSPQASPAVTHTAVGTTNNNTEDAHERLANNLGFNQVPPTLASGIEEIKLAAGFSPGNHSTVAPPIGDTGKPP